VTYGSFSAGTARRAAFAPGVEHISVLYSRAGLREALDWLQCRLRRAAVCVRDAVPSSTRGPVARPSVPRPHGPWPAPLRTAAPRRKPAVGASLPWRTLLPLALGPAILTPLILWKMPTDFLHVGDYLGLHLRFMAF